MRIRRIDVYSANWYLPGIEDMLRYDLDFINREDRNLLALPLFTTRHGDLGGRLTKNRWRSFGVYVEPADPTDAARIRDNMRRWPDEWITCRHPLDEDKRRVYEKLCFVPLSVILD